MNKRLNNKLPFLLGVTGSFGTGKSFVGKILKKHGVFIIDTDAIVRNILKARNQTTRKIIKRFGTINKTTLAQIVFGNAKKRKLLESIVHPEVIKRLKSIISRNNKKNIIAVLVPLLFECKLEHLFHEVWCVICKENIQYKRLLKKGYLLKDIKARIKAHLPQKEKSKRADFVIDNSNGVVRTQKAIIKKLNLLAQLNRSLHLSSYK